jgi:hypothetical protein
MTDAWCEPPTTDRWPHTNPATTTPGTEPGSPATPMGT